MCGPENRVDFGLSGLVGYRLQGRSLALPGDLPALGPQDLLWARGTAGKHFHVKSLTGTKEPLRDAKAQGGVSSRHRGQRGVPVAK